MRIAVLHPGEMGAAVGQALRDVGHDVCWLPAGRSAATVRRAEAAGLTPVADLSGCAVALSICPPAAAVETARAVSGFTGRYVDANAVAPATARTIAQIVTGAGATYVDGGIIGGPPVEAGTTRLYLSDDAAGDVAGEVAELFAGSRLEARILMQGGRFAASGLKMAYAAWTKGSAALLLSVRATAVELGVEPALLAEWALSQPDAPDRAAAAHASAERKGWRWEEELRQIGQTFAAAGQPEGFGSAAADVYAAYPRPAD